jgi:hypothetical protein
VARPRKEQPAQRESPIQFRPGSELGHRVRGFSQAHGLQLPEACRLLLSLAIAELDCRFAGLILPLAEVMGGENAYVRACEHVHTALQAARRATGMPLQLDPERARFIEETVKVALSERDAGGRFRGLEFLHAEEGSPHSEATTGPRTMSADKKKRTLRPGVGVEEPEAVPASPAVQAGLGAGDPARPTSGEQEGSREEPGWSVFGEEEEGERPRVRT